MWFPDAGYQEESEITARNPVQPRRKSRRQALGVGGGEGQLDKPEKGRRQTQNFLNDNIDDDDHYFLLLHVQAIHTLSQFFFTKIP